MVKLVNYLSPGGYYG